MKSIKVFSIMLATIILILAGLCVTSQTKAQTVLNNDRLRFGTGSENSVNTSGNLQQPFYYNGVQSLWRKLTYSSYPLDNAYAIDGDKTNEWNLNGTIVQNPSITGQVINTSAYVAAGSGKGYGTIISTGQVTIGGKNLDIENTYTLPSDKSYIEVKVKVTNRSAALVENVRIWIGTRDDWVGETDQPTKQKGNLVDGEFVKIANQTTRSAALKILSGDEGVLFYTNSNKGNTITQSCCSWSNVINQDPQTAQIEVTNDGSYGFYVRFNDLAPNASDEFTWYYAAGELAELEEIIEDVAEVSGAVSDITYTTAVFKATSTLDATGYWMVVPRNSTAPVAAEIKAGSNYGSVTVTSHGSGAMLANVEKTFNISGLSAGTAYDLYFVSEDPSPAFSDVLRVQFSSAAYTAPIVSSTTAASSITGNTASSGGDISNDGGQPVTERGVCWNTSVNPTIANSHTSDGSGAGSFTGSLTGLTHTTTYYVRAYATNNIGTSYGPQISFTTLSQSVPTLTTAAASSITQTDATSGGNVTNDGGLAVTERGVCWNTSGAPVITDNHTSDGAGSGSFSSALSSLNPGTTYYVRAYGVNSLGTGYGNEVSFSSDKYPQTITFNEIAAKTFGDPDFDPAAEASSELEVIYTSSNENVATIVNGQVHITGAGSADITATQAGNGTYHAAPDVTQSLTVNKKNQTITFIEPEIKTYGDTDFAIGATASSSLTVSYSSSNTDVATILDGIIHIVGAGTSTITASQPGNSNFEAAEDVQQTLIVNKADQTIDFASLHEKFYGNSDFDAGATASSALPVTYSSSDESVAVVIGSMLHIIGAGSTHITALQAGDQNYNAAAGVQQDLIVGKALLIVTANDTSRVYGDENPDFRMTYSGFVNGDSKLVIDELPIPLSIADIHSGTGTYAITPAGGNDNNYEFSFLSGELTVEKAMLTVTAEDNSKIYGEENPPLTFSFSGFKNGEDTDSIKTMPIASTIANKFSNAGTYDIDVEGGSDNNYNFTCIDATLTIHKKSMTAKADDKHKTYGDFNPALSISYDGFVNDDDVSDLDEIPVCNVSADEYSDAGSYEISVSGVTDNNYSLEQENGTMFIQKKTLNVTVNNAVKVYGDPNPEFSFELEGFVNSESADVIDVLPQASTEANAASDAGFYPIGVQGGMDNNYELAITNGELEITKREITAKPADISKSYGDQLPEIDFEYAGLVNNDTGDEIDTQPAVLTSADEFSAVGEYSLTAEGGSDNNYTFNFEGGLLTVTPKELIVTAAAETITYGDALPELTWNSEGFVLDQDESEFDTPVIISTDATEQSNAGEYNITVSGATAANYDIRFAGSHLTISKANLNVYADEKSRCYAQSNPDLSFTYEGFVHGEDASILNVLPVVLTEASEWTPVGSYDIELSGGEDENYNFNFHPAVLTITKADQTINFEAITGEIRSGNAIELVASSSSGLPIEFLTSDPEVASATGNLLQLSSEGGITITASQSGDDNWNPVTAVQSLSILPSFDNSDFLMSPNGDGINDFWHINYLDEYGKSTIRVFNRWGKRVFESSNYANDWGGIYNGDLLPAGAYYFIIDSETKGTVKGVINIIY